MALEDVLEKHIVALNRNSDALEKMMAGGAGATRSRNTKDAVKEPDKEHEKREEPKEERKPPTDESNAELIALVRAFSDYGEEGNDEDEKERDDRADFVQQINKHFGVKKARDIPVKNFIAVKRWLRLFAAGDKVDFDKD